jgi:hypothetical protein
MSQFCRAAYLLAGLVSLAFLVGQFWNPPAPAPFRGLESVTLPDKVVGYASRGDVALPEKTRATLGGSDFVARTYTNMNDITSSFDFALLAGTDRTTLHDPRGCMIGAGWTVENDHTEMLPGTKIAMRVSDMVGESDTPAKVQAGGFGAPDRIARKGLRYEVLYTYLVDGAIVQQVTQIRWQMLLASLLGQKGRPVYYCVFMRPHRDDVVRDREDGERLRRFADAMWQKMDLVRVQKRLTLSLAVPGHSITPGQRLSVAAADTTGGRSW